MNDHGEGMQAVVGVLLILCGITGALSALVCVRHLVETLATAAERRWGERRAD